MSKQKTTRTNNRHSPTAASRANKGTSGFVEDGGLTFIEYMVEDKVRRETKPPPTRAETAHWLSSTLRTHKDFAWDHYLPSEDHIKELKTSGVHRNAFVHFKNHFSVTSKQFGWSCSGKDLQEAWRYAPKDLKAVWNGIFQVNTNTKPTNASGGRRQRSQISSPTHSYAKCEPIQVRMPVASTSNVALYNSPHFSCNWNSPPTHFGSPPPSDAEWHYLYEGYLPVPQVGAEVSCYVPPPLSQEWPPPISSGAYLRSGYSSPASAASSYSVYSGGSYFFGSPSSSASHYMPPGDYLGGSSALGNQCLPIHQASYDPHPVVSDHDFQWASVAGTQTRDLTGSRDPLSHQTQPYPSPPSHDFSHNPSVPVSSSPNTPPQLDLVDHRHPEVSQPIPGDDFGRKLDKILQLVSGCFHEPPLVDFDTEGSSFLPNIGTTLEQRALFNFEDHPDGSPQGGLSIEDVLASLNAPVESDSTFDAGSIGPATSMSQRPWPAYEESPGCLPETGAALGHHPQSNPRYFNEANFEST